MNIQKLLYEPLTGYEMMSFNKDARLLKYTDLYHYNNIQVLPLFKDNLAMSLNKNNTS